MSDKNCRRCRKDQLELWQRKPIYIIDRYLKYKVTWALLSRTDGRFIINALIQNVAIFMWKLSDKKDELSKKLEPELSYKTRFSRTKMHTGKPVILNR